MRNQFTIMAALGEQMFRVGFLKISAAYFTAWNLRRYRQHWNTAPVAIVEPIDQMEISRPATSGTDRQASGKVRFGACRKGCCLFMSDVNPLKLLLFANRVRKSIEGVAGKPIHPFYSRLDERIYG